MIIRGYERGDRDACAALFEELVETHRALYPDAWIGSEFRLDGTIVVAEEDGRVVGYAGLLRHGCRAELEPIVVARERRGRGIGRRLVERIVEDARAGGAVQVFAHPVGRKREALAFFHSVGLDVVGYVHVQLDLEPRERRAGPNLAARTFRI